MAEIRGLWWDVIFTHSRFSAVQLRPTVTWVCLHPVQMTSLSFCCSILLQRSTSEYLSTRGMCFPVLCSNITSLCYGGAVPPPCGCRVGVDCAVGSIFIPLWSIFFCLYSALVLHVCTFCCQGGFNNSISGRSGEARDSFNSLIPDGTSEGAAAGGRNPALASLLV